MRRFYIPADQLGKNEVIITGTDAHHLRDVLRFQIGDKIILFDGTGWEYPAQLVSVERGEIKAAIREKLKVDAEPGLRITLAQGYLKDKKMDAVVRQLTELGVSTWLPFFSRRSVPSPNTKRLLDRSRRWHKISLESLKQCGRSRAMTIEPAVSLQEAIQKAEGHELKIIFWEDAKSTSLKNQIQPPYPASVFILIGPEGGFEADEISYVKEAGFIIVGLGPRTLKAETAAVTAASVIQTLLGDMG